MKTAQDRIEAYRRLWADEIAGAALYRALAERSKVEAQRATLLELAAAEERHAGHWEALLREAGEEPPRPPRFRPRLRLVRFVARQFGMRPALAWVRHLESAEAERYDLIAEAPEDMARDERDHRRIVTDLADALAGQGVTRSQSRRHTSAGGALRAAVFGANDGLVSNLSLVMGVAGGTGNPRIILLAGMAGLLAGALSMAAGEWVSVKAQRELYEREIQIEREELAAFPEDEERELAMMFAAKGIAPETAAELARSVMRRPGAALDMMVREELGFDPNDLASPWVAAGSSFVAFGIGAVIPVIPFLLGSGAAAVGASSATSAVALFMVGAATSVVTGRRALRTGARQVAIGAAAALATYGIGTLIGVGVSG